MVPEHLKATADRAARKEVTCSTVSYFLLSMLKKVVFDSGKFLTAYVVHLKAFK